MSVPDGERAPMQHLTKSARLISKQIVPSNRSIEAPETTIVELTIQEFIK